MGKDLTVKTLHKAVDWIVNESCEDICQICAYYNEESMAKAYDEDEDKEPCIYKRTNGCVACRNGIIEHFQTEAVNGKRTNKKP